MMKLAIAQMVLGAIILINFFFGEMLGYKLGGPWIPAFTVIILACAVLGCGIAQYLKAREARS